MYDDVWSEIGFDLRFYIEDGGEPDENVQIYGPEKEYYLLRLPKTCYRRPKVYDDLGLRCRIYKKYRTWHLAKYRRNYPYVIIPILMRTMRVLDKRLRVFGVDLQDKDDIYQIFVLKMLEWLGTRRRRYFINIHHMYVRANMICYRWVLPQITLYQFTCLDKRHYSDMARFIFFRSIHGREFSDCGYLDRQGTFDKIVDVCQHSKRISNITRQAVGHILSQIVWDERKSDPDFLESVPDTRYEASPEDKDFVREILSLFTVELQHMLLSILMFDVPLEEYARRIGKSEPYVRGRMLRILGTIRYMFNEKGEIICSEERAMEIRQARFHTGGRGRPAAFAPFIREMYPTFGRTIASYNEERGIEPVRRWAGHKSQEYLQGTRNVFIAEFIQRSDQDPPDPEYEIFPLR